MAKNELLGITIAIILLIAGVFFIVTFFPKGKSFSDFRAVLEKNNLDGTLAPGTADELQSFENDLLSLKAQASVQKSRETEALLAMIDFRLAIVKMQRDFLNSIQEAKFIDYYNPSCSKPTSIKKTIDYLDNAISQNALAITLIGDFSKNYPDFSTATGFDLAQANQTLNEFKTTLAEQKNKIKQFCI